MSSMSLSPLLGSIDLPSSTTSRSRYKSICNKSFAAGAKSRSISFDFPRRQRPIFRPFGQECTHVVQRGDQARETVQVHKPISSEIEEQIDYIKRMLSSIEGGRISISAYDTAYVALTEYLDGSGEAKPQFPACLQWIGDNQLPDGSWGATFMFSAYDRLINTLACVIALRKWNLHTQKIEKGISFIKDNVCKIEDEKSDHMTIGFEILFPSLLQLARKLDIQLLDDSDPILRDIYAKRKQKLSKIPEDILYKEHTTLHFSLEGMEGLDWEKIVELQCTDGSMLFSPASTAHIFMQTKDANSLKYLSQLVQKFDGGVPYIYPVDMFARNWAVDKLRRLGISRYFQPEITECINYVSRNWTDHGAYSTSNTPFYDIDDTAMCFANLRLHGHEVSPEVFWKFKHGDAFCCFPGQTSESVTVMFNLYRACQLMFPGEIVLVEAKEFAYKFLQERLANNQIQDKWVVPKDLPGEVRYALEMPWYASLPRVEARFFVDQYGGEDDLWIGKNFYRMPDVNSNRYLQLAILDFNICQALHQIEWENIREWYENSKLEKFGIREKSLKLSYFLAAASIFEPERSAERLAWAKSSILVQLVESFFDEESTSYEQRKAFMLEFSTSKDLQNGYKIGEGIMGTIVGTLNDISIAVQEAHQRRDIYHYLHQAWEKWLHSILWEGTGSCGSEAELLVCTINVCTNGIMLEEILSNPQYQRLCKLTNRICQQLCQFHNTRVHNNDNGFAETSNITTIRIESDMQELVQLVLQGTSDGLKPLTKQTSLTIAKCFYYTAYCSPEVVAIHIDKVLFQPVI